MICKIFHIFYDLRLETRVAQQLLDFKNQHTESHTDEQLEPKLAELYPKEWGELEIKVEKHSTNFEDFLRSTLLDLSLYQYEPLTTSALALLFRIMKPHDELVTTMAHVQILREHEEVEDFYKAKALQHEMQEILKDNDVDEEEMPRICEIVLELILLCCTKRGKEKKKFFLYYQLMEKRISPSRFN